jgi:cell division topological specificity factor
MASWIDQLFGRKPSSAGEAKERLKLVLINDRTDLTAEDLERMKNDLLVVISRYIEIDPTAVHISMSQEGREQRLLADIPLKPARKRRSA